MRPQLSRRPRSFFFIYRTFLHYAAQYDQPKLLLTYLHKRLEKNAEKWKWQDDLHNAAYNAPEQFCEALFKYDVPNPYAVDEDSEHAEDEVAQADTDKPDKIDLAHIMIDAEFDPSIRALQGETPLHLAAEAGSHMCVSIILALFGKIQLVDNNKLTALHYAIRADKVPVAQTLIENGIDINAKDVEGNTAMHYAARSNLVDSIRMLQEHKADVNIKNMEGRTPLHAAAEQGHMEAVQALLELEADPNIRDINGWAPLRLAIKGDFQDISELLLQYGTRPY